MVQKFPETFPPLPVRALTLAHISREMRLNCALICIIVHINEASAYEYSYFLFCCLIKKGDGGAMTAPAIERNRSRADEWIMTLEPLPWRPRSTGGGHGPVSANSIKRHGTTQHTLWNNTHHWRSRTCKTGKNYSSTRRDSRAYRDVYYSRRSTIAGLPADDEQSATSHLFKGSVSFIQSILRRSWP